MEQASLSEYEARLELRERRELRVDRLRREASSLFCCRRSSLAFMSSSSLTVIRAKESSRWATFEVAVGEDIDDWAVLWVTTLLQRAVPYDVKLASSALGGCVKEEVSGTTCAEVRDEELTRKVVTIAT